MLSYDEDNPEFDIQLGALSAKFEKYSYYVGILPEMRFLKNNLIFFNVGYSLFFYQESNLEGISYFTRSGIKYLENELSKGGVTHGCSTSIGVNPKFKRIGFLLNFGMQIISKTRDSRELLKGVGLKQYNIRFGLSYDIH